MTTTIPEDFFTLSLPIRSTAQNSPLIIPPEQRRADDTAYRVALPAGFHTLQCLWRGDATPILVRLWDGSPDGRNIAVLPGGVDAKTVTVAFVVAPGGTELSFLQQYTVTGEQVGTPLSTLGATFILNPARTQEA